MLAAANSSYLTPLYLENQPIDPIYVGHRPEIGIYGTLRHTIMMSTKQVTNVCGYQPKFATV